MQYYFLDTSAVVKRYHQEIGTDAIDSIFDSEDRIIVISNFHFRVRLGYKQEEERKRNNSR